MAGIFTQGQTKVRPGVYFRTQNVGLNPVNGLGDVIVAAVFQADWGLLEKVNLIETDSEIDALYSGQNTDIIRYILSQGAKVLAIRVGTGGTKATKTLVDTTGTPVNAVTLTAKYAGTRALSVSIQDSLTDATKRELLVYSGTSLKEKITFTKGATGNGEPAELVAAVDAYSTWLTATFVANGNKIMATVSQTSLTGGANPTITNTDYSNAFEDIEAEKWSILCLDTNTTAIHSLADGYIDRLYQEGNRKILVIGEPSSVAYATRLTNAAAYNDFKVVYLINGITDISGVIYDGWKSAAILAGIIAVTPSNRSITHKVASGFMAVSEPLTNQNIEKAINAGAVCFTANANGQPQVEYGITTFITPNADYDAGYKKIRRVMTRFELMARIDAMTEPLIGQVNNNPDGRSAIQAAAQSIIDAMIKENKLLQGTITLDSNNAPVGDSVWFVIDADDVDSGEKFYLTYNFRYSPLV